MTNEEAIQKIDKASFTGSDGLDYVETLVALDVIKMVTTSCNISSVNPEAKTGHWICTIEDWNKWTCSECGFCKRTDIHVSLGYNYCPNCGARMKSENKDEKQQTK